MELLAPAGNIENFFAAIDAGADAVYIGAPGINARNLSRDLQLEEIGAMIKYGHGLGKKIYLAANSLILEKELPQLIETLFLLESLGPDALIVQDLAIINLVREYFPKLRLHASTLMTGHNSDAADLFASMGCERVVIAREMTLKEISRITRRAKAEIEVFVHGAMCYSYSGLCLFSSFHGGKSSMRGRCVQPCRRGYTWQGKQGKKRGSNVRAKSSGGSYLFSMNDLEAFDAVAHLKKAGVASLKIEGRLRSANYVSKIVQAYRMVMDADDQDLDKAVAQARVLAEEAMSRKTSPGYFFSPQPQQAIVPHHSGNMGLHMGSVTSVAAEEDKILGKIKLKKALSVGDRLRLHVEATGERKAFTLQYLKIRGESVESCAAGDVARIALPAEQGKITKSRVELYKVDNRAAVGISSILSDDIKNSKRDLDNIRHGKRKDIQLLQRRECGRLNKLPVVSEKTRVRKQLSKKGFQKGINLDWWLKTDSDKHVLGRLPFSPDMFLLGVDKKMVSQSAAIKRYLGKNSRKVIWALPPVVLENDLVKLRKQVHLLLRSGFRSFQVAHLSQISLFGKERVHICSDYTLNLTNSKALGFAAQTGLEAAQLSIEMDRDAINLLIHGYKETLRRQREELNQQSKEGFQKKIKLGLTVYGAPPLFTSRLSAAHFQFNKSLKSPKGEEYTLKKKEGTTLALPVKPFSLLPYLGELQEIGFDYIIVDISHKNYGEKDLNELAERMGDFGRFSKLPTFNYLGKLE
jgi:putative protease